MQQANTLPISDCISQAWGLVKNSKASFWAAILLVFCIVFAWGALTSLLTSQPHGFAQFLGLLSNLAMQLVGFLFQVGFLYLGIKRARSETISYHDVFKAVNMKTALYVVGAYIIQTAILCLPVLLGFVSTFILMASGNLFLVIGGLILLVASVITSIYLLIRLMFTMAFVVDKEHSPVQAVKASYTITQNHVLNLAAISALQFLIILISILPLFIGLIWTLPFGYILFGTMYQRLTQPQQQSGIPVKP